MIVVEIALQGVKGFPELVRLRLKPGLNVAQPNDRALGAAVFDAFYHTLYPDSRRPGATAHLVTSQSDRSRMAITFFGRDRVTYRMIREADGGGTKLYTYTEEKKQYHLFSDVASEARQYVRVQQRLPDDVTYERLFVFAPQTMPSRAENARTRSGAPLVSGFAPPAAPGLPGGDFMGAGMARPDSMIGGAPPRGMSQVPVGFGSNPGSFGSSLNVTNALVQSEIAAAESGETAAEEPTKSKDDLYEELDRLKDQLTATRRAESAQHELDQLNMRRFELTEKVERVTKLEHELAKLKHQSSQYGDLQDLPPGFSDRLKHYDEMAARYKEDFERLTDEIGGLEQAAKNHHIVPLSKDMYFLPSAAGAGIFVGLAVAVGQPLLALLNIACGLVAAGAGFRYISDLEHDSRTAAKIANAKERYARLEKQHALDTGAMRRLMAKLEVDSPNELLERLEGYEKLTHQREIAEETLGSLMRDPEMASASRELDVIKQRAEVLETDVMASSGNLVSADSMERRIRRLEKELGEPPSDLPQPAAASSDLPARTAPPRTASIRGTPIPGEEARAAPTRTASIRGTPVSEGTGSIDIPRPASRTGSIRGTPVSEGTGSIDIPRPASRTGSIRGTPVPSESTGDIIRGKPTPMAGIEKPPADIVRQARARTGSIVGTPVSPGTGDLRTPVPRANSARTDDLAPPSAGKPALPSFPGPASDPTPAPAPPPRSPSVSPPPRRQAQPRSFSTFVTPIDPTELSQTDEAIPTDPLAAMPKNPIPNADTGSRAMFDFSGGNLVDEDDDDGYGSGYGGGGSSGGGSGGASTSAGRDGEGWYAVGYGGAGFGGGGGAGAYGGEGGGMQADRSRDLLQAAVDILQMDVDDLGRTIEARLGQYLSAFTDKKFGSAQFGPRGEVAVVPTEEGDPVGYTQLEGDELDLVDSAIRFCLVETIVQTHRIPVLFDDPFTKFPEKKRKLLAQMLAYLGGATQVIVMTPEKDITGHPLEW